MSGKIVGVIITAFVAIAIILLGVTIYNPQAAPPSDQTQINATSAPNYLGMGLILAGIFGILLVIMAVIVIWYR